MARQAGQRKQNPTGAGRPRSEKSHRAILKATLELLAKEGLQGMSIEGVAERAGVGKTSIYRRWASKEELALAALEELEARKRQTLKFSGDLHTDITRAVMDYLQSWVRDGGLDSLNLFMRVLGESGSNPEMLRVLFRKAMEPRIRMILQMVEDAKERGEIRKEIDLMAFMAVLGGSLFYHQYILGKVVPLKTNADQILDIILHGVEPRTGGK